MLRLSRFASFLCAAGILTAAGRPTVPADSQAAAALARLPLRFEANQGQTALEVRYTAHAAGYTLLLTDRGPVFRPAGTKPVAISLVNSNPAPRIEALDRQRARTDYFLGSRDRWRTDVASYARVRYREVYPGIDVVYYGNQSQLEYDFVLRPGADPNAIRILFEGPGRLTASPEGELVLESAGTRIVQKPPAIYQQDTPDSTRRPIAGRYTILARNEAGFHVERYDRRRPLVIDPAVTYCSYLGGTGSDRVNAVKLGPNNRLYITGQTDSSQIGAIDGAYLTANAGVVDVFLAIVDVTPGNGFPLVYFTYLGGTGTDIPFGLDVDYKGVAYITGGTDSTDFPAYGGFQTTNNGSGDGFVAIIDPSLYGGDSLVFSSYLGGTGADEGDGIAVDASGKVYVIGTTQSSDFAVTTSAFQPVLWGSQDAFLCQIDPYASGSAGAITYATYLGGEDKDYGVAILLDSKGLVYFTANTLSTLFPMAGYNYNPNPSGAEDAIIGVMDMSKQGNDSLVYATYFGGSGHDEVRGMGFDAKGNLLITGLTLSSDLPVTRDALQPAYSGNSDAWVAVVNPANAFQGFLLYSTYLGGAHGDAGHAIKGDSVGNIYVTGYTLSSDFPVKNAAQADWGGGTNVFLTKFRTGVAGLGAISYSTFVGSTATYVTTGIDIGADGTSYVVGYGYIGLPSSGNAFQGGFAGGATDGFLLVIAQ